MRPPSSPRPIRTRKAASRMALVALTGSVACFDLSNPMDPVVGGHLTGINVRTEGIVEVGDTTLVGATGSVDGVLGMFQYAPILDARWAISPASTAQLEPLPPPPADSFQQARTLVRGVAPGTARVTATSHGVVGEATVRVIPRLTGLEVLTPADTLAVGDTVVVTIRGLDLEGHPVADLPALVQTSGGIDRTTYEGRTLIIGTAAGLASLSASFHQVAGRKDLVVVGRTP